MSRLACTRRSSGQQRLKAVNVLGRRRGERLASITQHPERHELAVDLQDAQSLGADRDDRDRVRVVGFGPAVGVRVEESNAGGLLSPSIAHTRLRQVLGTYQMAL